MLLKALSKSTLSAVINLDLRGSLAFFPVGLETAKQTFMHVGAPSADRYEKNHYQEEK